MTGIFDPVNRKAFSFRPPAVIAFCGSRLILLSSDQDHGAIDHIRKICFHGLCQQFHPMTGQFAVLILCVGVKKTAHQLSPVFTGGAAVSADLFQNASRESAVHRFRPLQKPDLRSGHIASL